jgi:ribonuclease E
VQLTLGEVGLHDPNAGMGKVDGLDVCVAGAGKQVGKKVTVQIERVLDGMAYATLVTRTADADEPITAEGEAEKPTRAARAKPAEGVAEADAEASAKKKTRRGSRGGRTRKKATAATANGAAAPVEAKIHIPDPDLGEQAVEEVEPAEELSADGDGAAAPKPKKKTRRGTRGGRNRKKKTPTTAVAATADAEPAESWDYVPMSEWGDDVSDES